jgi:hypothetical protein
MTIHFTSAPLDIIKIASSEEEVIVNPRFLYFKDAVLARAETNKNGDVIGVREIKELAASVAGTHIDLNHKAGRNVGVFTAGREQEGVLYVDGIIWLDACIALGVNPEDIGDAEDAKTYRMSVEANVTTAECSVCHKVHANIRDYCEHLENRVVHHARRILRGLRASGGALTNNPAGSGTGFGSGLYVIANHQETEDLSLEPDLEARVTTLEATISDRKDVTPADKKRADEKYGDSPDYADEKNHKYPLDTEEHVKAANSYIGMAKNAAKYSPEEVASIKSKIKRAGEKYHIDFSAEMMNNEGETSMADSKDEKDKKDALDKMVKKEEELEKQETSEEEKKESLAKEKREKEAGTEAKMKAAYDELTATVTKMSADLLAKDAELSSVKAEKVTLTAQIEDLSGKIKASLVESRRQKMAGLGLEAEFEANKDKFADMDETTLGLILTAAQKATKPIDPVPAEVIEKEKIRLAAESSTPAPEKVTLGY